MTSPSYTHQLLAVALLVTVLGSVYFLVVEPAVQSFAAARAQRNELAYGIATLQRSAKTKETEIDLIQRQRAELPGDALYRGSNAADVASELQDRIGQAAAIAGIEVRSSTLSDGTTDDRQGALQLTLNVYGSLGSLEAFMRKIEFGYPVHFIDRLVFQRRSVRSGAGDDREMVDVQLDIRAYYAQDWKR